MDARHRARRRRDPCRRRDRHYDRAAGEADLATGQDCRGRRRGAAPADRRAQRHRADQRLGRADPPLGARPAEGGGGQMTVLATSGTTYWTIALIIGLAAALIVA